MAPCLEQVCEWTPASASLFPKLEAWMEYSSHQKAIESLIKTESADKYRDLIDCIFCEIFVDYQPACMAYYEDEGPRLAKIISKKQRVMMEAMLMRIVKGAYEIYKKR